MNLLGLATRARQLASGEMVLDSVRKNKSFLVLYASDASQNTKKQIIDKCAFYHVEAIEVENSELLSAAIGKTGRKAVSILSEGFSKKIKEKL